MLLIIALAFVQGGLLQPLSMGSYSPPAAAFNEFMRGEPERVIVYGEVLYFNETSLDTVPLNGVAIRLFATDELLENRVFTDIFGQFESSMSFRTGQIITVTFENGYRESIFIPYNAVDSFYFGRFFPEN